MPKAFMVAVMVVVLTAVFAAMALPEITGSLVTTQAAAPGISEELDLAMTAFPFVLSISVTVIITMVVIVGLRRS